mmetsp:Transcript_51378/g.129045  ORF Transcript_51378/g.129045 Transcript_51378/m.129045 type:complete len:246 (-) Transcript_51378:608-1345(-)
MPKPLPLSPYSSSASGPNLSLLACLRNSLMPYFSFMRRYLRPPRLALGFSSGRGSAFFWGAGGGSCDLSRDCTIFSLSWTPTCPWGDSLNESTRAAKEHFPATSLTARLRKAGGVPNTRSDWKIRPTVLPAVAVEKPTDAFFCDPISIMFCAGMRERLRSPPACVSSRAARADPRMAVRLGAIKDILDSRYSNTSFLHSARCRASSAAPMTLSNSEGGSGEPVVMLAATVTAMMTVLGSKSDKSI